MAEDLYIRTELSNGLRVVLAPNKNVPVVGVSVWYRVGSKDDPTGRSGFAHLFEHLMFKQAGNLADEGLDRLTEDVGGSNNAFTSFDVTVYEETVPSNHLERILWAEAERLKALSVNEKNFLSEREVVKAERRESIDNDPDDLGFLSVLDLAYTQHPYKNGILGSIQDLDQATLTEVLSFHRTFYQPNNAVLSIAGDLDPQTALTWIRKYFEVIPLGPVPPRQLIGEPPVLAPRNRVIRSPLVNQAKITLAYPIPDQTTAQSDVFNLLPYLLTEGAGSRLEQELVTERQLALEVNSAPLLLEGPGLMLIDAVAVGADPVVLQSAIETILAKLGQDGPGSGELTRAKTKYLTEFLSGRQTPLDQSLALGEAELWFQDPRRIDQLPARIEGITAQQVQQVVQEYLVPNRQISVVLLPGES